MISPYKRYVDDIYLQTTVEETADHFHHVINNVHPNLKFGLQLSLPDVKVTISKNGNSSFEFYKKPAKKPLFVHPQSAIPTKSKLNFIRNERKRIEDRSSSNISTKQHLNTFDGILHLNGYPEKSIEQTKRPLNPQQTLNLPKQNGHTLIPYISERLNHRITNNFRKENIPVRIAHKSYTLRQALSHTSKERKCTRDRWVWLIVAGRGSRVQSRGRGSNVAVAGPMSRSRVQSRGRGSNVAAGENDLGFEVTAECKRLIWTQYKGKNSFLCTILHGSQFTGYGC